MAATIKAPVIFTATDRVSAILSRMSRSVKGFSAKASVGIARVEHRFNRLMRPLGKVNRMLGGFGAGLGLFAAVAVMGNVIKTFKDFEKANAQLSSVMSNATAPQLKLLKDEAQRLGSTTAKSATEVVGLQEAFARLGFETADIVNMTESTISGSIAMNAELDQTANLVGAMVRTFEDFSSQDTPAIIDKMTASTQKSALSFAKLETSLPIVAGAANAAGVDFDQLLALLGKLSDSGIDASSSATSLRNIFLESSKQGLNYGQILDKIVKNQDQLTAANDQFGKRAAISGVILAKNIKETENLAKALGDSGGAADKAAKKQLATLDGALTILESSYQGFILSLENGEGAFGKLLTNVIKVTSEVLSLLSGSAAAKDTLDETELTLRNTAETTLFWLKGLGLLIGSIVAFKAIIIVSKVALAAYNIVMGISAAITQSNKRALIGNTIAQGAYRVAMVAGAIVTGVFSAAQWVLNAAMAANPIGLVVVAIIILIALITAIIVKYDEWGAALSFILGPIGLIINIIQSFRRNWEMVKEAFSTGGILGGLKAIGLVLLDSLLMPMQQLLEMISKIPGLSGIAGAAAAKIASIREGLGVNTGETGAPAGSESGGNTEVIGAVLPSTNQASSQQTTESIKNSSVSIDVRDKGGNVDKVTQDGNEIPINMGNTVGAF
jgi:hypothetical protein